MDVSALSNNTALNLSRINNEKQQHQEDTFQSTLNKAMEDKNETELKKACYEFESYFMALMLKEMRKTVDSSDSLIPKSNGEMIFQEMLDDETAKNSAKKGGMGLADMMYKQLSRELGASRSV